MGGYSALEPKSRREEPRRLREATGGTGSLLRRGAEIEVRGTGGYGKLRYAIKGYSAVEPNSRREEPEAVGGYSALEPKSRREEPILKNEARVP